MRGQTWSAPFVFRDSLGGRRQRSNPGDKGAEVNDKSARGKGYLYGSAGLTLAAGVVSGLAPPVERLGDIVKIVYFHAAVTWVAMLALTLSAVLGLAFLASRRPKLCAVSVALERASLLFWAPQFVMGFVVMRLAWGGILWGEPRLLFGAAVLTGVVTVHLVSTTSDNPQLIAAFNSLLGSGMWLLLAKTGRIFHPTRAISESGDWSVMAYPFLAMGLLTAAGLCAAVYLYEKAKADIARKVRPAEDAGDDSQTEPGTATSV